MVFFFLFIFLCRIKKYDSVRWEDIVDIHSVRVLFWRNENCDSVMDPWGIAGNLLKKANSILKFPVKLLGVCRFR